MSAQGTPSNKSIVSQPDLFGLGKGEQDIQAAHDWRVKNPAIYYAMLRRAQKQAAAGQRVAIDELFNWARYSLEFQGDETNYKLNNNLRAPLARLMVADFPTLKDYMELRASRSDIALEVRGK